MGDVLNHPCKEVVHSDHFGSLGEKAITEVRSDEASGTCY